MKVCTKCGVEKDESEFYKAGKWLRGDCKSCFYKHIKTYMQGHETEKTRYQKTLYQKKYRTSEKGKNYHKEYERNNKEKRKAISAKSYKKTKDWHIQYTRQYRQELGIGYIKYIAKTKGFSSESLKDLPEVLETLKIIIKTKRLWHKSRTSKNSEKV